MCQVSIARGCRRLKLSIIIATHDRANALNRLVASLTPQLRNGEHELFVADNGTRSPSPLGHQTLPLTQLHDPRPGKCRVQNRAIAKARGSIIACLDDDLTVAPDYVEQVVSFFEQYHEFAAMKGHILAAADPSSVAGELAPYLDLPIADDGEQVIEVRGVLGANMAFRAEALRSVGPFDERLGPGAAGHEEETEMSNRLRQAGYRIGYAPRATVYHEVDASRADRERFIRIARERGFCRMIHERHSAADIITKLAIANVRIILVRLFHAPVSRIAREERRLAIARGMHDGLRQQHRNARSTVPGNVTGGE
jgi:glucosyl-dolichyl phosphate glucuronosyltransferase